MAKRGRPVRRVEAVATPKDLAQALSGVVDWIEDIRKIILKLDPDCKVTLKVPVDELTGLRKPYLDGCPPPE